MPARYTDYKLLSTGIKNSILLCPNDHVFACIIQFGMLLPFAIIWPNISCPSLAFANTSGVGLVQLLPQRAHTLTVD